MKNGRTANYIIIDDPESPRRAPLEEHAPESLEPGLVRYISEETVA